METNPNNRLLANCLTAAIVLLVGVPLLLIAAVFGFIFKFHYDYEHGHNYKGMSHKFYQAMKAGDGEEAIKWAKKIDEYWTKNDRYQPAFATRPVLGIAYEMNGDYEESLAAREDYYRKTGFEQQPDDLTKARIFFKQGKRKEAFEQYCIYADWCLVQYEELLKGKWWNERNIILGDIRYRITMEHDYHLMRLSPFLEYENFLAFVEEEHVALESPEKYTDAMKLFRAIAEEIDEEHLPRSGASDNLDAMREKILEERRAANSR